MTDRGIAIVGMGCRLPGAADLTELARLVRRGEVPVRDVPTSRWNHGSFYDPNPRRLDHTYAQRLASVDAIEEFSPEFFGILPRRARAMDPQQRLLLDAARAAIEDAGLRPDALSGSRTGVFAGISVAEYYQLTTARLLATQMKDEALGRFAPGMAPAWDFLVEDVPPLQAYSMVGQMLNMTAANVAQAFDLRGPAFAADSACSSALVALGEAILHLRSGACDAALVGGVYLAVTPNNMVAFSRIGAISRAEVCRPFDARADGFVLGEGAGCLLLKRVEDAVAAGDRIWAVVRGFGMNNDGRGEGPMTPRLGGQVAALEAAYRDAGIAPAEVGLVEAHGTATPVGDRIESQALAEVLGAGRTDPCWVSGIKGNIGHTLAAAGAAGLMNAALAVADGVVPPLAGHEQPRGELPLRDAGFVIPRQAVDWGARRRIAGVSSFGFGGTNVHIVLEEPPVPVPPRRRARALPAEPELFLLSAPSEALLVDYARRIAAFVARERPALRDVAFTLSRRRVDAVRAAVVASSCEELVAGLETLKAGAPLEGAIALCFPGQGAQAPDLCRDLWQRFPWFRGRLEEVAAAAESVVGRRLIDVLYPERDPDRSVELLRRTEICQPALAAVELALAGFLARLGVAGDLAMGHSLGEFVAVAAAGAVAPEEAVRLVAERGRLMAELEGDAGAMAALATDRAGAGRLVEGTGAVLANFNHPRQVVASGANAAIDAVVARAEEAGVRATRLPVSHAFHSPVVAPMAERFRAVLDAAEIAAPARRVVSCAGEPAVLEDAAAIRERLARHAVSAFDFEGGVRAAYAAGARAFVQVGAGAALCSMISATLAADGARATVLAAAPAEASGGAGLLGALAELWNAGAALTPEALFEGTEARMVALPSSPLATRPFWLLRAPTQLAPLPSLGGDAPAAAAEVPPDDVLDLFRRQLDVIESQLAVLRDRGVYFEGPPGGVEVPAGLATAVAAAPSQPRPRASAPEPARADRASVEQRLVEIVARVSALPAAGVEVSAKLSADLGLDSLMMVELGAAVQEAFGLGEVPAGLVDRDVTIAELAERLAGIGSAPRTAAPQPAGGPRAPRHLATWVPCPLPPEDAGALAFRGGAVVIADRGGVAEALAARLIGLGRQAHLVSPVELDGFSWPRGADLLVDVAATDRVDPLDEAALRAPIDRALALLGAAGRAGVRPSWLAASRGPRAAALAGFARALALEWPDRLARSVDAPGGSNGALASAIAQRIAAELTTSDRVPEVSWVSGERRAVNVVPAPHAAVVPMSGATAVISGGARGLGAVLARHLAATGAAAKILLLGRRHADAEVDALLAELARGGAAARYASCDVADPAAVALAVAEGREAFGPFELVVHAAGETADGPVDKATARDGARVFAGKVAGALALWRACESDPLACFLLYGSWAGRFGNRHQTLYAAANRALSGLVPALAAERPAVRVVSIDLPPWPSGGMVERLPEAVRRAMRGRGVPFLSDEEGLAAVTAELTGEPGAFEVVLGAAVGAGRRDRVELALDPDQPWLADHQVEGTPRLPLAAILELAAAAAHRVGLDGPLALRDLHVLAPIAGDVALAVEARGTEPIDIEIAAGGAVAATCRIAPGGELPPLARPDGGAAPRLSLAEFYRAHTFHGPRMRAIAAVREVGPGHVAGTVLASPAAWPRASDILAIDGALQLAGFFARERLERSALPVAIQEARVLAIPTAGAELDCLAVLESADGDILRGHIDLRGPDGQLVAQIRGLEARVVEAHHIDPATWRVEEFPEVQELAQRRAMLAAIGLENPYFHLHEGVTNQRSHIAGVEYVNYSSYNYVSLSGHPEVNRAVERAVARYGTSVSASRVASGERPLHRQLERAIADFLGCEDAIAMVSGHATNVSVIGHLLDQRDVILHDSLAHDSILGGAKLSGARRRPFPHNDTDALEHLLAQIRPNARRVLIAVEGVYSMDGDLARLDRIVQLKKRYGALLLVDEAHSLGVVGATGRGIGEHFAVDRADVDLWMGTLSKSLASCGGYIAGSAALIDFLKYTTPGFIYSVGLTPANAAAALAALEILTREPERVATLHDRCRFFLERMRERGIDTGMSRDSAVVPCIVPSSLDCLRLAQALHGRGINVQPILYPAVEENLARLRFFVTSGHSEADLVRTAEAVRQELMAIGPRHLRPPAPPSAGDSGRWEQSP
ncbi:MAG TPA: aminotransferase class I/II-fold pyridoxal phosphate-dependent enzyme [Kofleriaceae bacterium]